MPLDQLLREGTAVPITRWDQPVLHRPARPVESFGPALWNLLCTLFATNRAARGAGLAAPQVGVDLAVFVYDTYDADGVRRTGLVCNPVLEPTTVRGTGYLARCLQHESDHLHGTVMEDRLSSRERKAHRRQHAAAESDYPGSWPV